MVYKPLPVYMALNIPSEGIKVDGVDHVDGKGVQRQEVLYVTIWPHI